MPYLGNTPASRFTSMDKQTITGDGTTGPYTLDHAVGSEQEIEVFVNNVRQEPSVAYTVVGTALTMTGNVASTDDFYVVFQGKAQQTATHPSGSALQATTGTFSGALSATTGTFSGATSSTDLTLSGGLYVGGTGSANYLDDYEEGSFTPTIQGVTTVGTATYSTQIGRYTKIGQFVDIFINLNWTSFTGTGVFEVHGLPFTNKSDEAPCGVVMYNQMDIPNISGTVGDYTAYMNAGGTKLRFYTSGDNATWQPQTADASAQLVISIQHRTDS